MTILDRIVAHKHREIAAARAERPEAQLRAAAAAAHAPRDFFAALATEGPIKLIAEVKKASPSAGVIREDFDPVAIGKTYEAHGATCISVLTDEKFFHGALDYLRQVRAEVALPVLRKDFILDTHQLLEARAAGADAVLLIAECLDDCTLRKLVSEAMDLAMTPLVELYEPDNLSRVFDSGATLIGVNNRNLKNFEVDLDHTLRIREHLPEGYVLVSESGIRTRADVERLEAAGVDAILVGESLMREEDIGAAVDRLLGRAESERLA
jgi:indole-3-glycerol phosphate synthase